MPQPEIQLDAQLDAQLLTLHKLDRISSVLIELEGGECNSSFFLRQLKHQEIHALVLDLKSSLAPAPAGTSTS